MANKPETTRTSDEERLIRVIIYEGIFDPIKRRVYKELVEDAGRKNRRYAVGSLMRAQEDERGFYITVHDRLYDRKERISLSPTLFESEELMPLALKATSLEKEDEFEDSAKPKAGRAKRIASRLALIVGLAASTLAGGSYAYQNTSRELTEENYISTAKDAGIGFASFAMPAFLLKYIFNRRNRKNESELSDDEQRNDDYLPPVEAPKLIKSEFFRQENNPRITKILSHARQQKSTYDAPEISQTLKNILSDVRKRRKN